MRLSLLARKLNVKPSEIIEYLDLEGQKAHGNSKLSEENIEKVLSEYGPLPEEEENTIEEVAETTPIIETAPIVQKTEETTNTPEAPTVVLDSQPLLEDTPELPEQSADDIEQIVEVEPDEKSLEEEPQEVVIQEEVVKTETVILEVADLLESEEEFDISNKEVLIKAPKVSLPGLSVKGKIDLPEPKPKEVKAAETETSSEDRRIRGKQKRKDLNPIATRRKREERAEERRKKALQEKVKEKKRKHYEKTAVLPDIKPKKTKKKSTNEVAHAPKNPRVKDTKPKNAFQKFWKWMNT